MYTLNPGEWYLRYTCKHCNSKQVLFPDQSKGEAEINAVYEVSCHQCNQRAFYGTNDIERYHHPKDAKAVPSSD